MIACIFSFIYQESSLAKTLANDNQPPCMVKGVNQLHVDLQAYSGGRFRQLHRELKRTG